MYAIGRWPKCHYASRTCTHQLQVRSTVIWVMMPRGVMCWRFRNNTFHTTPGQFMYYRWCRQQFTLTWRYITTQLHGVTFQKIYLLAVCVQVSSNFDTLKLFMIQKYPSILYNNSWRSVDMTCRKKTKEEKATRLFVSYVSNQSV